MAASLTDIKVFQEGKGDYYKSVFDNVVTMLETYIDSRLLFCISINNPISVVLTDEMFSRVANQPLIMDELRCRYQKAGWNNLLLDYSNRKLLFYA